MDDFDDSDLSALFAEVDQLEATRKASSNGEKDMAASNAGSAPTCQPIPGALQEPQGPSIIAPSGRLALTPHTNPQQKGVQISAKGQTSTPRSREEIRRLFTKRPALPHSATLQPTLAHSSHAYVQQPTSRLQHQVSSVPAQCQPIPISGPLPGSRIRTDAQHAGATHPHSNPGHVQHQALTGPADFQAPPSFRQFACPSSSLSAPASGQRSSGHSSHEHHALQRNSLPVQRASSASTGTCTEGKPPSGPTATSSGTGPSLHSGGGPMLRAEILMGPAATIEVNVRFHANIAAALKKLEGAEWLSQKGVWRMPMLHYTALLKALLAVPGVRLDVQPLPTVAQALVKAASALPDDSERYAKMPARLQEKLMGFQREGIKFALKRGGRLLVGDEMGLGKTVQAIGIMACYRDEWPCVIITPSSLREQWADALHQWLGITDDCVHMVAKGKDCQLEGRKFQFLITSYNFVPKLKEQLQTLAPQVIVLDEAHSIKASKSVRTQETVPLLKAAKRVVLLTGTPALSRPKELFSQLTALAPAAKLKMKDFGERYCQCDRYRPYGGQYDGASNLAELNRVLNSTVMVRRLKSEVLDQLPPKRRQHVHLQLQEPQNSQMKALRSSLEKARELKLNSQAMEGKAGGVDKSQQQMIMELYQKCATLKSKAVAEHVGVLLDADEKFLIFSHHTDMHNAVEAAVRGQGLMVVSVAAVTCSKKVKFIRIDGSTPAQSRGDLVNKFQQNADVRVAILSINAAGTGLTLTAASMVVFAEYSWTPGTLVQAEDRVHRIGQANSVNVYYLHAKGSIDDIIWQTLEHKLDDVGQVLNGKSDSFQMLKSQQQVSANQGRLDAFMSHSQPSVVAPAASAATAAPPRNTAIPSTSTACPPVAMSTAPRPPAAPLAHNVPGRPSWVRAVPNTGSSQQGAVAPRDITNVRHTLGGGPGPAHDNQQHPSSHTISPGKQTRLQSFFQTKQVTHQQHGHHQEQFTSSRHMHGASAFPVQASSNSMPEQPDAQLPEQHQLAQQNKGPQAPVQLGNNGWQQQEASAHGSAPIRVSGVFADDDDFDDIWMSDHAFQAQIALKAPAASVQQQHSIMAMPVIDLVGSPAHKKARS